MPRTALVAGATGLVGGLLVQRLLAGPAYARVHVLVRRPIDLAHPQLTQHVADFDALPASAPALQVDDAFCALGTTIKKAGSQEAFRRVDLGYVEAFARAAHACGANRFVLVSALGASPRSRIFYNRVKGEAEDAVRGVPIESVHIFRPSILLGERTEKRPGERAGILAARLLAPLLVGPLRRYRGTPADALAAAMVAAAKEGAPGVHVHEAETIPARAR